MSSFHSTTSSCRSLVLSCTSIELLLVLFGALPQSSVLAELFYLLILSFSLTITVHNIALEVDGREEIYRAMREDDVDLRPAILLLTPPLSGMLLFLCDSGNALFSFFVLIHVLTACGQLVLEVFEVKKLGGCVIHPNFTDSED